MIVLDTHVWVWLVSDPRQLSAPARKAVDNALSRKAIYISSISAWEVGLLVAKGRLQLAVDVRDWIAKCEALPFFRFVPVDNAIFQIGLLARKAARRSGRSNHHSDSAHQRHPCNQQRSQNSQLPRCQDDLVTKSVVFRQ